MKANDFISGSCDTEKFVDGFVESVGGELIKKRFKESPTFNNADYYFQKQNVVIELKSLKSDFVTNSREREKKLQHLFDKWYERGQITQLMISNPYLLPSDFKLQTLRLFK